jgi:hypothetical protein
MLGKSRRLLTCMPQTYPVGMSRQLRNWNYRNIIDFLKDQDFSFDKELGGSHQAWIKRSENGNPDKRVEVNFTHGS